MNIQSRLRDFIQRYKIKPPLGIAFSGGMDSMALLYLLKDIFPVDSLTLLYVNHHAREDSSDEEKFVRDTAEQQGVRVEVGHFFYLGKGNFEEQAREYRYRFFEEWAVPRKASVLTAHHRDDQIETIFYRILRGTGLNGLGGIQEKRGRVFRPMLNISKESIRDFAAKEKIKWYEDPTNEDTDFHRNAIRHKIIPEIKKYFGSEAPEKILLLREDWLDFHNERYRIFSHLKSEGFIKYCAEQIILVKSLNNLYFSAVIKYFLETAIREHFGDDFRFDRLKWKELKEAFSLNAGKKIQLTAELFCVTDDSGIRIKKFEPPRDITVKIEPGISQTVNWGDWSVTFDWQREFSPSSASGSFLQVDAEKLGTNELHIGAKRKGLRFRKVNNSFFSELSALIADAGVPIEEREYVPVLYSGDKAVGGAMLGAADNFKIDKETKNILTVKFEKKGCNGRDIKTG